jgi:hypothetical protein
MRPLKEGISIPLVNGSTFGTKNMKGFGEKAWQDVMQESPKYKGSSYET